MPADPPFAALLWRNLKKVSLARMIPSPRQVQGVVVVSENEASSADSSHAPNLLNDFLLAKKTDTYPLPGTTGLLSATPAQYAALLRRE
jgi:hypothetical protein